MRYFSLFSGVGGFELAINNVYENRICNGNGETSQGNGKPDTPKQSVQTTDEDTQRPRNTSSTVKSGDSGEVLCVGFSEIDKYAISVYQYHYQSHKNYGDISLIDWNTVPDFDLVVGGSPCQDLSVAGKGKGLVGARSGLFFEFVRCLKEKQPTNFIWENVKGALSSSSGWDFARVQIEFAEAGYDVEWQVLNAKDFGVPQNRERIFVVGHLRGKSRPKVFPITSDDRKTTPEGYVEPISGTISTKNQSGQAQWDGSTTLIVPVAIKQINNSTHSNDRVYAENGISPSLNTMQGGRRQPKILGGLQAHQTPRSDGISPTLNSAMGMGGGQTPVLLEPKIRRLTPLECERLMSWPDNWTKTSITGEISDTQRYKICGNGVVSKVVEAIIQRLYD